MASQTEKRIQRFIQTERVQAGSLIVSLFGDAVYPRGGAVWLGCLIRLLAPLEVNERLIRTAIFRLVKDDWLQTETHGRRTNYVLSASGANRIAAASKHIYANRSPVWDGRWRLLMLSSDVSPKDKERLKKALRWQGFGTWQNLAFVHPSSDLNQAFEWLQREGLGPLKKHMWPLLASGLPQQGRLSDNEVVAKAWGMDELALSYQRFVKTYRPLARECQDPAFFDTDTQKAKSFILRLLLIHDYRRLLLRDPLLPSDLLPAHWPGDEARHICKTLYETLRLPSELFLNSELQLADGRKTKSLKILRQRFQNC